jgi:hypothetical protein
MATSLPPKVIELIIRLHLFITGAERKKDASGKKVDNPEVENAEDQLDKVLKKHGLSRNDIHGIVAAKAIADDKAKAAAEAAADEAARREGWKNGAFDDLGVEIPNNDILALLIATVEQYVHAEPEEILTLCLRIMHTPVYDRFSITPRLFIHAPMPDCGKTTTLKVCEQVVSKPCYMPDTTAAAIRKTLAETPGRTYLIDEGDNIGLLNDSKMRKIFNHGHDEGGRSERFKGGASLHSPLSR